MIRFLKALILKYGFGRREPVVNWLGKDGMVNVAEWQNAAWFYSKPDRLIRVTDDGIISMEPAAVKARRLASIARERGELKDARKKAASQKKKVSDIDRALRALTNEEIKLELGR